MIELLSRQIREALWGRKSGAGGFPRSLPPLTFRGTSQPKTKILKHIAPSFADDDGGCFAIVIAIAVIVGIVSAIVAAVTAMLEWMDQNIVFFVMIFLFVASLVITSEVFASLRRKVFRTDVKKMRSELNLLRDDLEELQRQRSGYISPADYDIGLADYDKAAAKRPKPPEGNEPD